MPWVTLHHPYGKHHRQFGFAPGPGTVVTLRQGDEEVRIRVRELCFDDEGDGSEMRCFALCEPAPDR